MNQSNKAFLDANRNHAETVKLGFIRNLSGQERESMQRIMSEEFWPGYAIDLWCPTCVFDMVKQLYARYDEWIARQPVEEPLSHVAASFPVNDKPVQSHKKHHRK